jgi:methylenetetrahydrofolate reductase (NADPH)
VQFIRDIFRAHRDTGLPVVSLEFFPTKTVEGEQTLLGKTIPALMQLAPEFCSVTYGAGGSTRDKTLTMVERIQREHGLPAMAHLTCVNSTREQVGAILEEAKSKGIMNLLALRGDPPGGGEFRKVDGGFEFASELVEFIHSRGEFSIGVAGFPEGHIACKEGREVDWARLKAKVDRGADFVVTQLFFENADFFRFRDHLNVLGVQVPVLPGIIPISSASQIKKLTALCGAALPDHLLQDLERVAHDDEAAAAFGIEYATRQCDELLRGGVPGLHFYTLNKARPTSQIVENLGLASRPKRT